MSRPIFGLLAAALLGAAGCYQDTSSGPPNRRPLTAVHITDDPFPWDSVQSVQVYIVRILVSTQPDTGTSADSMSWVTLAEPHRQVDLLGLQQGVLDSLGAAELPAAQYRAVRVVINTDSSTGVRFVGGAPALMHWDGPGLQSLNVFVEQPMSVPETGTDLVIDFDVARSFPYNNRGDGGFDFFATLRAVNRAATGDIAGVVTRDSSGGTPGPLTHARVSAWGGGPNNWYITATGATDATGHYRLAYLLPGTYIVTVDPPAADSNLASSIDSTVMVSQGGETTHNVALTAFRGSIYINGASSMLVNRTNQLEAVVLNPQHQQDTTAAVVWQNLDTAVLALRDSLRFAFVTSKAVGTGRVVATSGELTDTLVIHVAADTSSGPSPRH